MRDAKYWVAAISKEHTMKGVKDGFIQVCHGKQGPLMRMQKGDYLIVYSSKITMERDEKCQAFTAIGQISGDEVYEFQMSEHFKPFRRGVEFYKCKEVSIHPLINSLEFIVNKKSWGYPFRFGFFEINENDFNLIAPKMLLHEITG